MDRADATGLGIAAVGHIALLAALILLVPKEPIRLPGAPTMEVSYEEEVGIVSAGETTTPAAASVAPELGAPDDAAPAPESVSEPQPTPAPTPPQPAPRQPAPRPQAPAQQRATPQQRAVPQPARNAPQPKSATPRGGSGTAATPRGSRLGPDFLKNIGSDRTSTSQKSVGAVMSPQALADIGSLIRQQVRPCANRQRSPGPGAERIRVTIRLLINRDGSLSAPPRVIGRTGVDADNGRYAERVDDLAINTFTACAPLRGLPAELYDVRNGWRDFQMRYNLPR